MKKVVIKNIVLTILILLFIFALTTDVYATIDNMKPSFDKNTDEIAGMAGIVLGVVQVIAIAVATIILVIIAIKYMVAAPEEKAKIKTTAIMYVVGAVIIFAAAGVLEVMQGIADTVNTAIA